MELLLFLKLFGASMTGMLTALIAKSKSMEETASKANVIYEGFFTFLKRDWKALTLNFLAIVATFIIFGGIVNPITLWAHGKTYDLLSFNIPLEIIVSIFISTGFYATGYLGQDFILRFIVKSVQNKLIKDAIDYKTNIADDANGTRDTPTPVK